MIILAPLLVPALIEVSLVRRFVPPTFRHESREHVEQEPMERTLEQRRRG